MIIKRDQAEAHRAKTKAARERRQQRIVAKKEAMFSPVEETPVPVATGKKA